MLFESGLINLNNSVVYKVFFDGDSIILDCMYQDIKPIRVTFTAKHEAENDQNEISKALGHKIRYVDVVEKGYEIHFEDYEEVVLIKAICFHFDKKF